MKNANKAFIFAVIAILSWSTVATSFKIALSYFSNYEMLLISCLTAFIILALAVVMQRKLPLLKNISLQQWGKSALIGLLNPVAYYLVLFKAYDLLPAQIAQPINYTWPILLLILLAIISRKPIMPAKYIGLLLSFGGVILISTSGGGNSAGESLPIAGVLLGFLSAFLWAAFWIVNKVNEKLDNTINLFLTFMFGSIYLCIGSLFVETNLASLDGVLASMYVGAFEMAIPFIFFGMALKMSDNTVLINQLCYLSPFMSLFIIHFVLGETIYPTTYCGLILIVSGIVFNEYFAQPLYRRLKAKSLIRS